MQDYYENFPKWQQELHQRYMRYACAYMALRHNYIIFLGKSFSSYIHFCESNKQIGFMWLEISEYKIPKSTFRFSALNMYVWSSPCSHCNKSSSVK